MKLSNKTRYGLLALFDLAFHGRDGAVQVRRIAERQTVPLRFLEQIFQALKRADLVISKRGPKGGYTLARPMDEIRLGDIVVALEGPIALAFGDDRGPGAAVVDEVLTELSTNVLDQLNAISLADLCDRGDLAGLRRGPSRRYVYSI